MNAETVLARLRSELSHWETRIGELRVQADLAGKELEARRKEVLDSFEREYRDARRKLEELSEGGREDLSSELSAVRESVRAGWDELRRTYEDLRKRN